MSRRPNFLVFCTDQHQSYCLGCNGHPMVQTPNIDAIAGEGVTFTRGYCNNPVCQPSRATLLTGLTPRGHGLLTNGSKLPDHVPTITQTLADSGYRTHSVGKLHLQPTGGWQDDGTFTWELHKAWHDGTIDKLPSPYYGFQTTDFTGGHVSYISGEYKRWLLQKDPALHAKYSAEQAYHRVGQGYRIDLPEELHYNHWIADRTIDFLGAASSEEPFFLFCSFPDPHFPYAACRPYSEMYDPASVPLPENWDKIDDQTRFLRLNRQGMAHNASVQEDELREIIAQTFGMITHVDANIGRVMQALDSSGLDDNTVVVVLADHGEYLGSHNLLKKGGWPWEELLRIPYVWRLPGNRPAQHSNDTPVSLLDFVPTIAELAGIDPNWHNTRKMQRMHPGLPGKSLLPLIDGDTDNHQPALFEYDEDFHTGAPLCRLRGIVDGNWKIAIWAGYDDGLLINLENDPHEQHNLWDDPEHTAVRAEMLAKLVDRLASTERFDTSRVSGA